MSITPWLSNFVVEDLQSSSPGKQQKAPQLIQVLHRLGSFWNRPDKKNWASASVTDGQYRILVDLSEKCRETMLQRVQASEYEYSLDVYQPGGVCRLTSYRLKQIDTYSNNSNDNKEGTLTLIIDDWEALPSLKGMVLSSTAGRDVSNVVHSVQVQRAMESKVVLGVPTDLLAKPDEMDEILAMAEAPDPPPTGDTTATATAATAATAATSVVPRPSDPSPPDPNPEDEADAVDDEHEHGYDQVHHQQQEQENSDVGEESDGLEHMGIEDMLAPYAQTQGGTPLPVPTFRPPTANPDDEEDDDDGDDTDHPTQTQDLSRTLFTQPMTPQEVLPRQRDSSTQTPASLMSPNLLRSPSSSTTPTATTTTRNTQSGFRPASSRSSRKRKSSQQDIMIHEEDNGSISTATSGGSRILKHISCWDSLQEQLMDGSNVPMVLDKHIPAVRRVRKTRHVLRHGGLYEWLRKYTK